MWAGLLGFVVLFLRSELLFSFTAFHFFLSLASFLTRTFSFFLAFVFVFIEFCFTLLLPFPFRFSHLFVFAVAILGLTRNSFTVTGMSFDIMTLRVNAAAIRASLISMTV